MINMMEMNERGGHCCLLCPLKQLVNLRPSCHRDVRCIPSLKRWPRIPLDALRRLSERKDWVAQEQGMYVFNVGAQLDTTESIPLSAARYNVLCMECGRFDRSSLAEYVGSKRPPMYLNATIANIIHGHQSMYSANGLASGPFGSVKIVKPPNETFSIFHRQLNIASTICCRLDACVNDVIPIF